MYRTFVILRHTFIEAVVQPIYPLLLALASVVLVVFSLLPFFTLGEDTIMFKSVALDVILLTVLITTLFATSKSIFEEIEDRTMLTLMSKPVKKWEVLLGKYLGIVLASLLAVLVLGVVLAATTWFRIPMDSAVSQATLDDRELQAVANLRLMHLSGLAAELVLKWLEISVLAAVGVALSTGVSLVVNLPVVIFVYIAGNLTRFLFPLQEHAVAMNVLAVIAGTVMPYLQIFDLAAKTVFQKIAVGTFANDPTATPLSTIWGYVAMAFGYAAAYVFLALSAGMWMFHGRELGGAEG